jgi:PrpF protein
MARAVAVFGFLTRDIVRRAIVRAERLAAELMEAIRCVASVAMAPAPNAAEAAKIPSVPKVAMIASPRPMTTLSGQRLEPADMSLGIRIISIGQPHQQCRSRGPPASPSQCASQAPYRTGWRALAMARSPLLTHPVQPWSMQPWTTLITLQRRGRFMARCTAPQGNFLRETSSIELPQLLRLHAAERNDTGAIDDDLSRCR